MKQRGKKGVDLHKSRHSDEVETEKPGSIFNFISVVVVPIFLAVYWIHFVAESELIYHKQAPPFFIDLPFLNDFLNHPDGIAKLVSAFMFQFHEYGWTGTLMETILILATCSAGWFTLRQFTKSKSNYLIFIIPAITPFFHLDYKCDPFHPTISALSGFLCFLVFSKVYSKNTFLSFLVFTILSGILTGFFIMGSFLLFLLAGLLALHSGKKLEVLISGLIYISVVYLIILRHGYSESDFIFHGSNSGKIAEFIIILIVPFFVRIRQIIKRLHEKWAFKSPGFIKKIVNSPFFYSFISITICLTIFLISRNNFDFNKKLLIQIDYFASKRQWDKVIETFAKVNSFNNTALVQLRRSLLYTGRILDDFFSYPQLKEKFFFPDYGSDVTVCLSLAEFFYELGHVNFAEHLAHESLEFDGDKPRQLILLSKINILKGKTNAAKVFLNRLKQNPFQRKTALKFISDIENNEPFKDDERFKYSSEFMNTVQYAGYEVRDETFFNQLLVSNPKNRLAFECLIATLLANKNLAEAMRLINAFSGFGFKTLPRHYEEAVLIWQVIEKHKQFTPGKYKINPETIQRFNELIRILEQHGGNLQLAKQALAENFGTTFWFYYFYEEIFNPSINYYKQ